MMMMTMMIKISLFSHIFSVINTIRIKKCNAYFLPMNGGGRTAVL